MSNTWMRQEICIGYDPTGLVPVVKQVDRWRQCPVHPLLSPTKSSVIGSGKDRVRYVFAATQETPQETTQETSVKTSVKILHSVGETPYATIAELVERTILEEQP